MGGTHALRPLRYPFRLRAKTFQVRLAFERRAALAFFRMREPHHAAPRVDAGACEHGAVFIQKRELAVAHAVDDAGRGAVNELHFKRGMRYRVPVAIARCARE